MRAALVALVFTALALSGCGEGKPEKGIRAEPKPTQLKDAYDDCNISSTHVALADGNTSILVDGAKSDDDFTDVACLMLELDTPQYIVSEMDNTTAMMGRQREEDGGISYDWSYHPDNGLNLTMHEDA